MAPRTPAEASSSPVTVKQVLTVVVVALMSTTQGTATKGWTAVVPKMQSDPRHFETTDADVAWLVSMTQIVGIFSSLISGPLVEYVGPRRLNTISLTLATGLWLLLAFPPNKALLYVARGGLAACVYIIATLVNPLVAELSPRRIRGMASALTEVGGSLGALIGYLLAFLAPWDVATALCTLTAAVFIVPLVFVPESPYWLVRRGKTEAAKDSLQRLMDPEAEVEEELLAISRTFSTKHTSFKQQFVELLKSQNFRPLLLVLSCFTLRELGGRSCVMMYTVYIFRDAGVELDAFTCTVLVGVTRLLCTCVSAAILDHIGRRPLLIGTAMLGAFAQGISGLFLYVQLTGASWVPLVGVLVYVASYGVGIGPIPWVYVGELIPSPVRPIGACIIASCDAVVVFSINFAFLKIISNIGIGVTFMIFGVMNILISLIVLKWIPETKGLSLQDVECAFSSKHKRHETKRENPDK